MTGDHASPRKADFESQWDSCIDGLYAAVGDEAALTAALGELPSLLGAQGVALQTGPSAGHPGTAQVAAHGVPLAMLVEYQACFAAEDPWVEAASRQRLDRAGVVMRGSALVPQESLHRTRFWRDYLARYDQSDILTAVLEESCAEGSPRSLLSFFRSTQTGLFDGNDEALALRLLPELQRVLKLHRRLAPGIAWGRSLGRMYEEMGLPMGFVDGGGVLLEANAAARAAMSHMRLLSIQDGRLHVRQGRTWQTLAARLAGIDDPAAMELMLTEPDGPAALLCLRKASAWQGAETGHAPALAVFALRPLDLRLDGSHLRGRFDLTPREFEVAQGLDRGIEPAELARRDGIGLSTVRSHVAALIRKTGSSTQTEMLNRLRGTR